MANSTKPAKGVVKVDEKVPLNMVENTKAVLIDLNKEIVLNVEVLICANMIRVAGDANSVILKAMQWIWSVMLCVIIVEVSV